MPYRGRFAPSPTGPLHFGSLFAAVISYLDAKAQQGVWLVRIENIDPPREQIGAIEQIHACLEAHGLQSDEPIRYQSEQSANYERVLQALLEQSSCYRCPCSRKELLEYGGHSPRCLSGQFDDPEYALRFKAKGLSFTWQDNYLGELSREISEDFVLKRKDGLYAYQLAVVADDIDQGITHVVRGSDLLDSSPMQLALYEALGHTAPSLAHFPTLTNTQQQKLSKQNFSQAVDNTQVMLNIKLIASLLNLDLGNSCISPQTAYQAMLEQWPSNAVFSQNSLPAPAHYAK